jgi:predicted O-methyltransferase YrrM
MNPVIEEILSTRKTITADDREVPLRAEVSAREGAFLYNLIKDNKAKKTLEVGCAMGISTLHICEALKNEGGALCDRSIPDDGLARNRAKIP